MNFIRMKPVFFVIVVSAFIVPPAAIAQHSRQSGQSKPADIRIQIEKLAASSRGVVGVAFSALEDGRSFSYNGERHLPMQSVYKFPIAMCVLNRVDKGLLHLDDRVRVEKSDLFPAPGHSPIRDAHPDGGFKISLRELLRYAVSESDGTASDVLLRVIGGPDVVTTYLRGLGVTGVIVATTEKQMAAGEKVQYRNWATADQSVLLLKKFAEGKGLSDSSHELLLSLMTATGTGIHRLKGELPEGTVVAHKTGTSGTSRGLTRATNDIGIISLPGGRHLLIAVYVSDSTASEQQREAVIAKTARIAWDWAIREK